MCATPVYSPESNGMAEAFMKTLRRDYAHLNRLATGLDVPSQLSRRMEDYNEMHPHRGLRMRSPRRYRKAIPLAEEAA
jgi:transposase InsO family protein